MRPDDVQVDPMLAALRELRACDVGRDHAQRLRARCLEALTAPQSSAHVSPGRSQGARNRAVGILAGAWCVVYLVETIRRAVAVYRF